MTELIRVGMAQVGIAKRPNKIETQALGSCAGVVLYEGVSKIGGISHAMLPYINEAKKKSRENHAKFVDSSIELLVDEMIMNGAKKEFIKAKLCGGANMFKEVLPQVLPRIGDRNIESAKAKLRALGIPLIAEDTGGTYGRTITLDTENGKLYVRTVFHGTRAI